MQIFEWIALAALWIVWMFLSVYPIHMLQLESYQLPMFVKCMRRNANPGLLCPALAGIVGIAVGAILSALGVEGRLAIAGGAMAVVGAVLAAIVVKKPQKKPLVFTSRVKRLMAAQAILFAIVLLLPVLLGLDASALYLWWGIGTILLVLWVYLAAAIMHPIEEGNKRRYAEDARRRLLASSHLIKIGITGSYGKTSAKFILGTLLAEKFNALVPPSSYNTPMGVTRIVREKLAPETQVFVCEMGARYVGDIAELCHLVSPQYGLITSIGKQHLETFKSLDAIISTKYELIDALPEDGHAFFPADNEICRALYQKTQKPKFLYGIDGQGLPLDMAASDISVSASGCSFVLTNRDGESVRCETQLLGKHNILNITGAACVAYDLGVSMQGIQSGIAKLQPIEHRLQLIPGANGVTVIDDAFNANPEGAKAALEVISAFAGRKIIVTPGMVELGEEQTQLNREFGERMADAVDEAILVGSAARVQPIVDGLSAKGFDEAHLHVVSDLNAATEVIGRVARYGDVVLFENDLPDNYGA